MRPHQKLLNEVVIQPKNKLYGLLERAIRAIPENYPSHPEMLRFFARNIARGQAETPYYMIEMTGIAGKSSYEKPVMRGNVQLLESQKVEFEAIDSVMLRIYAGGHVVHRADLVATRSAVLNLRKLKGYELQMLDTLITKTGSMYDIAYCPKYGSHAKGAGRVLIDARTLAIVQMDVAYTDGGFRIWDDFKATINAYQRKYIKFKADYSSTNEVWRLSQATYQTAFDVKGQLKMALVDELEVIGVDTLTKMAYQDRLDYYDYVLHEANAYDSTYWKKEKIIGALGNSAARVKVPEYGGNKPQSKYERLLTVLSKVESYAGVGVVQFETGQASVSYGDWQHEVPEGDEWIAVITSYLRYPLSKHVGVLLQSTSSFSKKKEYSSIYPGIQYMVNLNPGGRPVRLSPALLAGWLRMNRRIAMVDEENYTGKAQRKFDAQQAAVSLKQSSFGVSPQLGLSIEKSHRWAFEIRGGYDFMFWPRSKLALKEDEFFLTRKSVTLKPGADDWSLQTSSKKLFDTGWFVNAGVVLSF